MPCPAVPLKVDLEESACPTHHNCGARYPWVMGLDVAKGPGCIGLGNAKLLGVALFEPGYIGRAFSGG